MQRYEEYKDLINFWHNIGLSKTQEVQEIKQAPGDEQSTNYAILMTKSSVGDGFRTRLRYGTADQ